MYGSIIFTWLQVSKWRDDPNDPNWRAEHIFMFERSSCFRSLLRYTMQIYFWSIYYIFFCLLATCWKSKRIEREHLKCRKSNMLIWFGTLRKAPGFAGLLILPVLGLGRKVFLCWVELQPFGCLSNCSATATWCRGDDRKFWWMILEEASKMIHLNDLWKGFLKSILIHRNQKLEIRGVKSEGSNICLHILVAALQEAPLRRLCPDLFPSTLHSPWGGSSTSAARQWMLEVGFEWWNQWGLSLCCAGGWKLQPEISPGSVRRWQFYGTYPS